MAVIAARDPLGGVAGDWAHQSRLVAGKLPSEQPKGRPFARGWPRETIMKFGHRVYATENPRGNHPRAASAELAGTRGDETCFRRSRLTEEVVHAERGTHPSLDRRSAPAPRHAAPFVTAP